MNEPSIFQGRPSSEVAVYMPLDEEAETRRAEARYESWLSGEPVGYVAPSANATTTHRGPRPVCLTKRVPIDAGWIRRHRTTTEQQQKIAEELRAVYGPDALISFGAGAA